jgi:hypothetical protein
MYSKSAQQLHFLSIIDLYHHQTILKREVLPKGLCCHCCHEFNDNNGLSVQHPKRLLMALGKLLDTSNSAVLTLSSYQQAILAKQAEYAAAEAGEPSPTTTPFTPLITEEIGSNPDSSTTL